MKLRGVDGFAGFGCDFMNLMLAVLFMSVLVRLRSAPLGRRERIALAAMATTMTVVYFFASRVL